MCDCVSKMNELLAPHNAQLNVNLFDPTYVFIQTIKKDTKKRGKVPHLAANYCPFCGAKYSVRDGFETEAA